MRFVGRVAGPSVSRRRPCRDRRSTTACENTEPGSLCPAGRPGRSGREWKSYRGPSLVSTSSAPSSRPGRAGSSPVQTGHNEIGGIPVEEQVCNGCQSSKLCKHLRSVDYFFFKMSFLHDKQIQTYITKKESRRQSAGSCDLSSGTMFFWMRTIPSRSSRDCSR